jgi:predicted O-linked N-acetylglucosamine transferase (SPINDLY family)
MQAFPDPLLHQAVLAMQAGRMDTAERLLRDVLHWQPRHVAALNYLGILLTRLGRLDEAEHYTRRALEVNAKSDATFCNYGLILKALKRPEEALAQFRQALKLNARSPETWNDRGTVFNDLKRYREAIGDFDHAIALDPNYATPFYNKGNALSGIKLYEEALAAYGHALVLKPDLAEAWVASGDVLHKLKRHPEAANAYSRLLKLDPQYPFGKGLLLHQKQMMCEWTQIGDLIKSIDLDVTLGKLSAEPFGWQAASDKPRSLQLCAELFSTSKFPAERIIPPHPRSIRHKKIRIGYVGDVFREQAVSHLMVGALELHDKTQFELYGFDNGWDDESETRSRVEASLQKMIDISSVGDGRAAAAIHEHEIDILVNLNVYFGDHRTGLFAKRPAPVQVNYLGFPATLGAQYLDYIIADQVVIPPKHKDFYTEKVVYLPTCYQANDRKKKISERHFTRAECRLPERGFVFCCFNNSFKITPEMFDRWMRILTKVEDSVLWLIEDNASVAPNLRKEAKLREVNPERLVFARRMPLADHLARHQLAGLFLDTLPYNAHTTASDALWAGLPVLTQIGETFPGRVGASLLNAIDLPELITSTPQAYEALAIELATNSQKLVAIKQKLEHNRLTASLFDTEFYARCLDAAYIAMYERYQAGLSPDHIYVSLP